MVLTLIMIGLLIITEMYYSMPTVPMEPIFLFQVLAMKTHTAPTSIIKELQWDITLELTWAILLLRVHPNRL